MKAFSAEKLHPHEPWFYLRAQDALSVAALKAYAAALRYSAQFPAEGDEPHAERLRQQARDVDAVVAHFEAWQLNHRELVRLPD